MASSEADDEVTELLKTHDDKSLSKKNTERFMTLYKKHKVEGVPTVENCNVIQQTYQTKGLTPTGVHTMFAPLLWYAQFYPWFYLPVIGGTGEHRLYVGDLVLNGLHQPLWVGMTPTLKFFTSLYKLRGNEYRLTKFNRVGIKWHWALEDVFGLDAMPYEDPNHPLGPSTGAEIFHYLNNEESKWDDRQNNAMKSLIWIIEAFPGLTVTPSPTEEDTVVQVYPGQPKFPFLVDDIDTSLPNIRTLVKAQSSPNATPATSSSTKAKASIAGKPSSSTAATKPVKAPLDASSKAPARDSASPSPSPSGSPMVVKEKKSDTRKEKKKRKREIKAAAQAESMNKKKQKVKLIELDVDDVVMADANMEEEPKLDGDDDDNTEEEPKPDGDDVNMSDAIQDEEPKPDGDDDDDDNTEEEPKPDGDDDDNTEEEPKPDGDDVSMSDAIQDEEPKRDSAGSSAAAEDDDSEDGTEALDDDAKLLKYLVKRHHMDKAHIPPWSPAWMDKDAVFVGISLKPIYDDDGNRIRHRWCPQDRARLGKLRPPRYQHV